MDELIKENMPLVISIVNSFGPKNHTEREDMIDAGRIGLWKAIQKYKKENGNLSTYAWRPIRWSIIMEIKQYKKQKATSLPPEELEGLMTNKKEEETDKVWELYTSDMTDQDKFLIELRTHGYKFHEICEIMEEKPSQIRSRFYKLIKKLREANAT